MSERDIYSVTWRDPRHPAELHARFFFTVRRAARFFRTLVKAPDIAQAVGMFQEPPDA